MSLTEHEDVHETSHTSSVLVSKHLLEPHMCCSPTHSPMHVHQHDNGIKTTNCALLTKYFYSVKECVYGDVFQSVIDVEPKSEEGHFYLGKYYDRLMGFMAKDRPAK